MGMCQSPDIAQEIMELVFCDIIDIKVYIDDIACFSQCFDFHMKLINKVLTQLNEKGFIINPHKCEWAIQETDFLGHWLTPREIKPYPKKIKAILAMQTSKNMKQLCAVIGIITYYRDMWPYCSHILTPLTNLLKIPKLTKDFPWLPIHDKAFQQMKSLVQLDTLLVYPDHNKPFHVETGASNFQLGAVIKQDDNPVAFYTQKLNSTQKNYTTIKKELLSVVETLKEFRSMLLGAVFHVYTNLKNLTHKLSSYTTQCVLHWRLLLEEYNPTFHYIPGPKNIVADALLQTLMSDQHITSIPNNDTFLFTSSAEGLLHRLNVILLTTAICFILNLTLEVVTCSILKLFTTINKSRPFLKETNHR